MWIVRRTAQTRGLFGPRGGGLRPPSSPTTFPQAILKKMLQRIGFFHFVQDHSDPITALQAQLDLTDASHSLLVLPEAFNLGRQYRESGPCQYGRDSMIEALQKLSRAADITFVTGLLDTPAPAGDLPYSSAYVIDAGDHRQICHKELPDEKDGIHYRRCPENYEVENPVSFRGASIAAMICMDIKNSSRCTTLIRATEKAPESIRVMCISAAFSYGGWIYNSSCGEVINFATSPDSMPTKRASFSPTATQAARAASSRIPTGKPSCASRKTRVTSIESWCSKSDAGGGAGKTSGFGRFPIRWQPLWKNLTGAEPSRSSQCLTIRPHIRRRPQARNSKLR